MEYSSQKCPFCESDGPFEKIIASEKMFGSGGEYPYYKCLECGSLWIISIPTDLSIYYGSDYYSFSASVVTLSRIVIRRIWGLLLFGSWNFLRNGTMRIRRPSPLIRVLIEQGVKFKNRILDVGCGRGALLEDLSFMGFKYLYGYDPNLPCEKVSSWTRKYFVYREFKEISGSYDLIMFNHSLEHSADILSSLKSIIPLLRDSNSLLVIRTPLSNSYAQRHYRENWVQFDAPRHCFIPSRSGLKNLLSRLNFRLDYMECDSTRFQFWGSEQNARNIPLMNPKSLFQSRSGNGVFSRIELRDFDARASLLNTQLDGDEGIFCFRKKRS